MPAPGPDSIDEVTLRRACRGDRDALGVLWRTFNPSILRFLHTLGEPEPHDVAAEVWLALTDRMPAIADRNEILTVLLTIARRRSIDRHRRRTRRPEELGETPPPPATSGFTTQVDARLDAMALLQRLPEGVAEVVYLRAALELPAAIVAEITGRSEGAVRVMAMRGLTTLRNLASDLDKSAVTNPQDPAMAVT